MKNIILSVLGTLLGAFLIWLSTIYVDTKHAEALNKIEMNKHTIGTISDSLNDIKVDIRDIHKRFYRKYRKGNK